MPELHHRGSGADHAARGVNPQSDTAYRADGLEKVLLRLRVQRLALHLCDLRDERDGETNETARRTRRVSFLQRRVQQHPGRHNVPI